jgi:hypothetical protein
MEARALCVAGRRSEHGGGDVDGFANADNTGGGYGWRVDGSGNDRWGLVQGRRLRPVRWRIRHVRGRQRPWTAFERWDLRRGD